MATPVRGVTVGGDGGQRRCAITALSTAFALDPKSAEWAKNDTDLDSIRGLPGSPV